MTMHDKQSSDDQLRQLAHDLRNCLHGINMGTQVLKGARTDEARFAEVCGWMEKDQAAALKLITELLDVAMKRQAACASGT